MEGVKKYHKASELELKALLAGNDILLCSTDVPQGIAKIKQAIVDGRLSEDELNDHVTKILALKKWAGCDKLVNFNQELLCSSDAKKLKPALYSKAITIVRDDQDVISTLPFTKQNLACINIGPDNHHYFTTELAKHLPVTVHNLSLVYDENRGIIACTTKRELN